jgi:Arc/MetJ family transcription regulator
MKPVVEVDAELMKKALKYSGLKSKKDVLNTALYAYVKYQMRLNILAMQGKVKWKGNLNKMRLNG